LQPLGNPREGVDVRIKAVLVMVILIAALMHAPSAASAVLAAMVIAVLLAGVMVWYANPASAQVNTEAVPGTTITVNTIGDETTDDGDCSSREAIEAADTNAPVDRCKAGSATEEDAIHFSLGNKAQKIVLSSMLPPISDPAELTIDGQKVKITVSGNDAVRVFEVDSGAKLTLARLTVADGNAGDFGGGVLSDGTLKVTNSTFSGNSATEAGGGIANFTTPEVTNSTFSANTAVLGGGIENLGTLEVTSSTFSRNSASSTGGGIFNVGGGLPGQSSTVTISNTIVANSPSGGNCGSLRGTTTDGGYNIDDGTTCGFSEANNSVPSTDQN
jgi:CSLREA domain-containing protein